MFRTTSIILICLILPIFTIGQNKKFYGIILNEQNRLPIANVNLKIRNTNLGTATNAEGKFDLTLAKLPVALDITCIGFETLSLEVGEIKAKRVEIRLKPLVRQLEGVTITELKATAVYSDPDYSVLDYEIMGDNLLILIFRYQLKRSTLLLMNSNGDTLSQSSLPELPPWKLYKDVLGNVHYFSKKGNSFQCRFDESLNYLWFPFRTTVDSLLRIIGNFSFSMKNRLYFVEENSPGFMAGMGYFDKDQGKKYLQTVHDAKSASNYYRDKYFFLTPSRPGDSIVRDNDARAYDFFTRKKSMAGMVKIGDDRIAVFNFIADVIEIRDAEGNLIEQTPISFHKDPENAFIASLVRSFFPGETWKWSGKILKDEVNDAVYTSFKKHGWIRISKIDIQTGSISDDYELPMPNVEKITIHHGNIYFLYKGAGQEQKWKLYKMKPEPTVR
ncbi:MAG: carboxypeptidase-like regulatory domain-containing protein [Bacteroidota bacterium]